MPTRSMADTVSEAIRSFRQYTPDYVASGLVDMSTGLLLGVDTLDGHPREILEVLAAATVELFQGRNVVMIEDIWRQRRGVSEGPHYFQEVLVNSSNLVHLFMRSAANADIVAVVVCRRAVNIGMLLAQARIVLREMDAALG
jgi:hypothetical protein